MSDAGFLNRLRAEPHPLAVPPLGSQTVDGEFEFNQAMQRPVKLQWGRNQDTQHDRLRPPSVHKIRATHLGGQVQSFEHRYTGGFISFSHGLGDAMTSIGAHDPATNALLGINIHALQHTAPYNVGVTTQTLREVDFGMTPNTGSWRSVYTGTGRTVEEIMMDEIAAALGKDPVEYWIETAKEDALKECIRWVAENGNWVPGDGAGHRAGLRGELRGPVERRLPGGARRAGRRAAGHQGRDGVRRRDPAEPGRVGRPDAGWAQRRDRDGPAGQRPHRQRCRPGGELLGLQVHTRQGNYP